MLADDSPLARFVFNGKDVAFSTGRVKFGAFMPKWEAGPGRFELSTSDVGSLPLQRVAAIADDVERERNQACAPGEAPQTVKGWAVMLALGYRSCGLTCDPDGVPPRHVNVLGWPPTQEEKAEVRLVAQRLARAFETAGGRFEPRPAVG